MTDRGHAHEESWLATLGLRLSAWFERWFPDAFSLALLVVAIVVVTALATTDSTVTQTAAWFGAGFWDLVPFTMQMAMIIVTGYVAATAPPVARVIEGMAEWPKSPRSAVAYVALFSMLSSLVSWSFSLIFSGLYARAVARRVAGADYRAIGAAAYLGVGSVWALGLSSSAALIMATPASMPASLLQISGVIPLTETLFLWQSGLVAVLLIGVSVGIAVYSLPRPEHAMTMAAMGVETEPARSAPTAIRHPGEWLEHQPWLTLLVGGLGLVFLAQEVATGGLSVLLQLNRYIFLFLMVGLLLHWRPHSFVRAVQAAVPSVGGVLIQYPIYAAVVRVLTESGLASQVAHGFVAISNEHTFPVLVGIYSAVLGIFIPSAGGKWLVEAPYLLEAAKQLGAHLGWVVQTYNATEALANLIHPFWMLPLLGILGIKPRDIVGYCTLQFIVHTPLVLLLVWLLNYTL